MSDETYNGWSNRETWALMLHINNDQGLYEEFRDIAREDWEVESYRAEAVRSRAEELLDPGQYRETFGEPQLEGLAMMAHEVGSLWRVNWSEVVDALAED